MKITICTTIKNRTVIDTEFGKRYLFLGFLESINNIYHLMKDIELELVVVDFMSNDVENLEEYIKEHCPYIPIKMIQLNEKFNRGRGLNHAIENASNNYVLVLDIDMCFGVEIIQNTIQHVIENNKEYFPICFTYENDPNEQKGQWLKEGFGNLAIHKDKWKMYGKLPEYTSWGQEDSDFYKKCKNKVREKCEGLIHQWHPSSIEWKNRYYK